MVFFGHILHRADDVEHNAKFVHLLILFPKADLHFALYHVRQNGLELIFRPHHGAAFGQVAVQVDGIEFTLGGTNAAANALVGVHHAGTAAQAAGCFGFYLCFGQGQVGIPERTVRVDGIIHSGCLAGCAVIIAKGARDIIGSTKKNYDN